MLTFSLAMVKIEEIMIIIAASSETPYASLYMTSRQPVQQLHCVIYGIAMFSVVNGLFLIICYASLFKTIQLKKLFYRKAYSAGGMLSGVVKVPLAPPALTDSHCMCTDR